MQNSFANNLNNTSIWAEGGLINFQQEKQKSVAHSGINPEEKKHQNSLEYQSP